MELQGGKSLQVNHLRLIMREDESSYGNLTSSV